MKKEEIRTKLLLSVQRALLGMIYPSIRAISVEFVEQEKITLIIFLDREPLEFDNENLSNITGEILADIEFKKIEEICICAKDESLVLSNNAIWVYMRQERIIPA